MTENRVCTKCGIEKPLTTDYFGKHKTSKNGFRAECKTCVSARSKEYNLKNKERVKKWRKENYEKNKEEINKKNVEWQKKNKESQRIRAQKRRAGKREMKNPLTESEWLESLDYFNHSCAYCGIKDAPLEQEHIIPFTRWGDYSKENIIPACKSCNSSKGNREVYEWYSEKDFYSEDRMDMIEDYMYSSGKIRKVETFYLSEEELEKYRNK